MLLRGKEQKDKTFKELRVLVRGVVRGLCTECRLGKERSEARGACGLREE